MSLLRKNKLNFKLKENWEKKKDDDDNVDMIIFTCFVFLQSHSLIRYILDLVLLKLNLILKLNFSLQQFPLLPNSIACLHLKLYRKELDLKLEGTIWKSSWKDLRFNWNQIGNVFPRNLWYSANQICLSIKFRWNVNSQIDISRLILSKIFKSIDVSKI